MAPVEKQSKISAGLLLSRRTPSGFEFFLVHPGGPFFVQKDDGWWTIPKGLVHPDEEFLDAAKREFREETGFDIEATSFAPLGAVTQKSGKIVHAWMFMGDCDPSDLCSNTFEVEWPPRSGRVTEYPEVDRGAFFSAEEARRKIMPAQVPFIDAALRELEAMTP